MIARRYNRPGPNGHQLRSSHERSVTRWPGQSDDGKGPRAGRSSGEGSVYGGSQGGASSHAARHEGGDGGYGVVRVDRFGLRNDSFVHRLSRDVTVPQHGAGLRTPGVDLRYTEPD